MSDAKTTRTPVEMKVTSWVREMAQLVSWDPSKNDPDPEVHINSTKLNKLAERYMKENFSKTTQGKFIKDHGTLYNVAKYNPAANNMMLLGEVVTSDQYIANVNKGKIENKYFLPVMDDAEEYLWSIRDMAQQMWYIRESVTEVELGGLGKLELPDVAPLTAINALLNDAKLPTLELVFEELDRVNNDSADLNQKLKEMDKVAKKTEKEVQRLKAEVTKAMSAATAIDVEYTNERAEIPDGKVVMKKAKDIFPEITLPPAIADTEIPTWEWDGEHPDVPAINEHYIFRPKHLQRTLYALVTNQREYIQGHTGSGKTTLIEQVAARLNWPFIRINFDSEITRMDLIGRDTLTTDKEGNVVSVFEDGMLPTAMSGPYITCFDELDFVRPDVAYVMQAALEGNGLRITEDGDRLVRPHPMFRMFGTGNTVGQGDENGMYQGARPQSLAFLDRFTIWDRIEYLKPEERADLLSREFPALGDTEAKQILQYITEHLEAFGQNKVIQPISPRGMLAIAKATLLLGSVREALEMTVLDRANNEDRATLVGLVDRVSK